MEFSIFLMVAFTAVMTGACFDELRAIRKALEASPTRQKGSTQ